MKKLLLILIIHISAFAQVPNTNTFKQSDVEAEIGGNYKLLSELFTNSIDGGFDATYKGNKDRLSNFRNYSHATIGTLEFSTTSTSTFNLTSIIKTGFTSFDYVVTGGLTTSGTGTSIDFSANTGTANVVVSFFPSSEFDRLEITNKNISSLDVTNSVNLTLLACQFNDLTALDVTNNVNLTYLNLQLNNLTSLDVTNNVNLTHLDLKSNGISSLDVTNNVNLTLLACQFNDLTATASDNIAIALDNHGNLNGILHIDNNFTAVSASARANLSAKGWSITLY